MNITENHPLYLSGQIEWTDPNNLEIPLSKYNAATKKREGYQRPRTDRIAKLIADPETFDPRLFHAITVAEYPNGHREVVDGQARTIGAKNYPIPTVPVRVVKVADRTEAVNLYLRLNQEVRKVPITNQHQAQEAIEGTYEERVSAIARDTFDVTIGTIKDKNEVNTKYNLNAAAVLRQIRKAAEERDLDPVDVFESTFIFLFQAFPNNDPEAFLKSSLIKAVANIIMENKAHNETAEKLANLISQQSLDVNELFETVKAKPHYSSGNAHIKLKDELHSKIFVI